MEHTDSQYEEELRSLKETILKMGGVVEEMIAISVRSLTERNNKLAQKVAEAEPEVNEMEMEIDNRCLQMLALRQPAASDLRFITIGLKINKDLERIGDLAVNISEQAIEINKEPPVKPYVDLPLMAERTQQMVQNALNAFVNRDAALSQRVCEEDDTIDDLNKKIFLDLLELMRKNPELIEQATRLIACAKHLERIADHATNIAEEVIFMVQGRDIRHRTTGNVVKGL